MNIDYQDKEFTCILCNLPFAWTSGEQSFLNDLLQKGKINSITPPKRCAPCRQKRQQENNNFNSGYPK